MSYCSKYINNEFESNVYWALSYIWNDYILLPLLQSVYLLLILSVAVLRVPFTY